MRLNFTNIGNEDRLAVQNNKWRMQAFFGLRLWEKLELSLLFNGESSCSKYQLEGQVGLRMIRIIYEPTKKRAEIFASNEKNVYFCNQRIEYQYATITNNSKW